MKEFFCLFLCLIFGGFCLFEDEPIWDLTDWNIWHVTTLAIVIWSILSELTQRAHVGQYVAKDLTVFCSAFGYFFYLNFLTRIILLTLSVHTWLPMEIELFELTDTFSLLPSLLNTDFTLITAAFVFFWSLLLLLRYTIGWGRRLLQIFILLCLILCTTTALLFLSWDLIGNGQSALKTNENNFTYYNVSQTSLTYETSVGTAATVGGDLFEWHRDRAWPFVGRHADLFGFWLMVLVLLDLSLGLILELFLLEQAFTKQLSFTQVTIFLLWLEQVTVYSLIFVIGDFIISLRIFLHIPLTL